MSDALCSHVLMHVSHVPINFSHITLPRTHAHTHTQSRETNSLDKHSCNPIEANPFSDSVAANPASRERALLAPEWPPRPPRWGSPVGRGAAAGSHLESPEFVSRHCRGRHGTRSRLIGWMMDSLQDDELEFRNQFNCSGPYRSFGNLLRKFNWELLEVL